MVASAPLPSGAAVETCVPRPRVADVFRRHALDYRRAHTLTPDQARVLAAVRVCRTAELGGFVDVCPNCGYHHEIFHSCRDRHCPTCQAIAQGRWIERRMQRVLPVRHFHVVFTVPATLRRIALRNTRLFYDGLFAAASETLAAFAKRRLGAVLGTTAVLHTWTREMLYHPHLHCVVTAGGLAADGAWIPVRGRFLFPVRGMAMMFRAILRRILAKAYEAAELDLGGDCADLADPKGFRRLLRSLFRQPWVVYAKAPLAGPEHVFRYLGQYTHRVAISDHRLVAVTDERITFRTRGAATVAVTPDEFLRRFLLHVLPSGLRKIRHFGLYAPSNVNARLPAAREAIETAGHGIPSPPQTPDPPPETEDRDGGCPDCGHRLVTIEIPRGRMRHIIAIFLGSCPDTS